MKKHALTALAIVGIAGAASAQFVVEQDLGALPDGLTNVMGDTATGANNAGNYPTFTNPAVTWGNELVYGFSLAATSQLTLEFASASADPDVFILDGLSTSFDGTQNVADNALAALFLDFGAESITLDAGNYFFSVDTFGGPLPGDMSTSTFSLDINVQTISAYMPGAPAAMTPSAIDLGVIGTAGDSFVFDTANSNADTELGLYDQAGNLVLNDDDDGPGTTSLIETVGTAVDTGQAFAGLDAGTYFLAISEFNTAFASGFDVTGGLEAGETIDWVLNIDDMEVLNGALSDTEQVQWVQFTIVPAPGAFTLLGAAGLAGLRRRRA